MASIADVKLSGQSLCSLIYPWRVLAVLAGSPDTPSLARPTLYPATRNIQTLGDIWAAVIRSSRVLQAITVVWLDVRLQTAPNRDFMRFGDQNQWR